MSEKEEIIRLRRQGSLWVCELGGKEYTFRKWAWGEKNRITSQCTRMTPDGRQYLDIAEFNLNLLMTTLKKAPFKIDRETIENYPDSILIDKLLQISTKLNLLGNVEIQNL